MVYLIRHGEPDQSRRLTQVYQGFGTHLCPLTDRGREQIQMAALDQRLQGADLILTSPYTRALQTGAILSRQLDAPILVETDLHEWLPRKDYRFPDDQEIAANYQDFVAKGGIYPEGEDPAWESREQMRRRLQRTLEKYADYGKVIVACHGMLIQAALETEEFPRHGEIFLYSLQGQGCPFPDQ